MSTLQAIAIIVGVVSGVSGLVLGILSYLHQRDTSRPRLVVRLHAPFVRNPNTPQRKKMPGVVIVHNVGHIPVVMSPYLVFRPKRAKKGGYMVQLIAADDVDLTNELKPQHKAWLTFNTDYLPEGHELDRVSVFSEVHEEFKPSRREMRKFTSNMRKFARDIRKFAEQRNAASSPPSC